jgi:uncharacterized protein YlxW (UPF0749 family)
VSTAGRRTTPFLAALLVLAGGFGYLLVSQFEPNLNKAYIAPAQNVELVEIMKGLEVENEKTAQGILQLRDETASLEIRGGAVNAQVRELTRRLGELRTRAGMTDDAGAGVVVTLDDSAKTPTLSDDPNYFLIHDNYLRSIINLMRRYGATAIAINEQRILASSAIVCAGPIILVNSSKMSPPYVITALGNPDILSEGIRQDVFFRVLENYQDRFGITCSLEKNLSLLVPASLSASPFSYAHGEP